jgi:hypothetical protein
LRQAAPWPCSLWALERCGREKDCVLRGQPLGIGSMRLGKWSVWREEAGCTLALQPLGIGTVWLEKKGVGGGKRQAAPWPCSLWALEQCGWKEGVCVGTRQAAPWPCSLWAMGSVGTRHRLWVGELDRAAAGLEVSLRRATVGAAGVPVHGLGHLGRPCLFQHRRHEVRFGRNPQGVQGGRGGKARVVEGASFAGRGEWVGETFTANPRPARRKRRKERCAGIARPPCCNGCVGMGRRVEGRRAQPPHVAVGADGHCVVGTRERKG